MDKISNWFADIQITLLQFNDPNNWWQLGVILFSLALAWLLSRLILRLAYSHHLQEQGGIRKFTLRSIERVMFPISALLMILIASSVFRTLHLPVNLYHLAMPLLLSFALVRMLVYLLRKGFAPTPLLKAWENIISTTVWVIVALYLLGVLPAVLATLDALGFKLGNSRITVLSVINFILLVALLFTLAMWLSSTIERRMHKTSYLSPSMRVGLSKFSKFFLIGLSFFIALDAVGIDLTALTVFGGALGVGLGFGLQRIASNFISGFLLLFDRSIKPGDVISIGNKFGWVEELRARYIVVRDRDGVDTLIPNENLITSEVINWSYSDRNVRLKLPVSISYANDPHQAIALMIEAARQHPRVLSNPEPVGRLMEFGDNGIALELRIWINDPEKGVNNVRSDINLAIWQAFKDNHITIPFPQRDVHVKHPPPLQ